MANPHFQPLDLDSPRRPTSGHMCENFSWDASLKGEDPPQEWAFHECRVLNGVKRDKGEWWLTVAVNLTALELTRNQAARHTCERFFSIGLSEVEDPPYIQISWGQKNHLHWGHTFWWQPKQKDKGSHWFLSACPHSPWQVHPSRSWTHSFGGDRTYFLGILV